MEDKRFWQLVDKAPLTSNCYASQDSWDDVRRLVAAELAGSPAFQHAFTDEPLRAWGCLLRFGRRPFVVVIQPGPDFPLAAARPQVIMTRPRSNAEYQLVYYLMENFRLILQTCKLTAGINVVPASIERNDLSAALNYNLSDEQSAKHVRIESPDALKRFFHMPEAWPHLR